ncbi:hypothetical protein BB560_000172 [Smittium megazygosporum]|uniref:Uncharacterized protein n=1 Tax=Smittium megazygosporum TaxID=133381 RepID=A0A2T9ZL82_9FUNG|nr:hypothetical protein BB560_000172 [Smittium megazygosporum]
MDLQKEITALLSSLDEIEYDEKQSLTEAKKLSEIIRDYLVEKQPGYKYVVNVNLGSGDEQAIRITTACNWDLEKDKIIKAEYWTVRP